MRNAYYKKTVLASDCSKIALNEPNGFLHYITVEPNDESYEAIGKRLEMARKALGVPDQQTFARAYMGVSPQAYTNMVSGRNRPSLNTAIRLHKRYGITMGWVYLGSTYGMPQELVLRLDQIVSQSRSKGRQPQKPT